MGRVFQGKLGVDVTVGWAIDMDQWTNATVTTLAGFKSYWFQREYLIKSCLQNFYGRYRWYTNIRISVCVRFIL